MTENAWSTIQAFFFTKKIGLKSSEKSFYNINFFYYLFVKFSFFFL